MTDETIKLPAVHVMTPDGRIVSDFEEYVPEAAFPDRTSAELDADAAAMIRQTVFDRHAVNRSGEILPADRFEKTRAAREKLAAQTMETALDLEAAGYPAFLPRTAPRFSLVNPDPLHEYAQPDLPVRRINYLPAVAAARRRPILTHLEAHVDAHPESTMATFTAGPRRAVEAAFRALDKCRHTAAMIGQPIRSIGMTIDSEGETRCRVRYFRIPKTKAELASIRQ
jgi:hypothetical protein